MSTQILLEEARQALHQLLIGKKAVSVQMNGRSVQYTPATKKDLEKYIEQLEIKLNNSNTRRPARVFL